MEAKEKKLLDAAEMLWVVVANVSGGDWSKQPVEWQEAAARWRDCYLEVVREYRVDDTVGLSPISPIRSRLTWICPEIAK